MVGAPSGSLAALRQAVGRDSMWGNAAELYAKASGGDVFHFAIEELGHELASRLLGDGYGTGEYQLYGMFDADLVTGEIVDRDHAQKPADLG